MVDRGLVPARGAARRHRGVAAARDRSRFFLSLGVVYALKPAGLRSLREALVKCVRSHPKVWPDVVRVHFTGLTDSSITVEITAWFQVTEQDQFLEARQELLLQLLEVIETFGATPAFARAAAAQAASKYLYAIYITRN